MFRLQCLGPVYDDLENATMMAQVAREAMQRISAKMAAQHKGEAFKDLDALEIPGFLRVDAKEAARRRRYWEKHPPVAMTLSIAQSNKAAENDPHIAEVIAAAEEEHKRLTAGKQAARRESKEKDAEERYRKKTRAKCGTEAQEPTTHDTAQEYWDAAAGKWRPIGYMSAAKYQFCLSEMPDDKLRRCFIKMFGHTQPEGKREMTATQARKAVITRLVATQKTAPAEPAKRAKKVEAAMRPGGLAKQKTQNPEHVAKVSAMLTRAQGATLEEIGTTMGWLKHSASAFLTGMRKTRTIERTSEERGTVYRLKDK